MSTILLFLHLCGVALLFIMISMEMVALCGAPRASGVAQLRAATFATPAIEKIAPIATVLIAGTGLWMVAINDFLDFGAAWVIAAIVATAVLSVAGPAVQGKRLSTLRDAAAAAPDGPVPAALASLARDRVMHLTAWASCGASIGFLYLMVERPGALGSILTFVVTPVAGIAIGMALLSGASEAPERTPQPPAAEPVAE